MKCFIRLSIWTTGPKKLKPAPQPVRKKSYPIPKTNVITAAKEESKNNYDVEIRKAEEEKDNAIKEMSSSIKSLREQYESAKKESAKRVLDELFQSI